MKTNWTTSTLLTLVAIFIGCQHRSSPTTHALDVNSNSLDGETFLLTVEPDGAKDVIQTRESAQDDDDVVIVGRIGGAANPWIKGRAAFSIVDGSLRACSDLPGDACKKPWDYCCETHKLPTSTALIKVVDENGDLVMADARELLNVEELSTVVVKGKAKRDSAGNLAVLASGIYVKKQ